MSARYIAKRTSLRLALSLAASGFLYAEANANTYTVVAPMEGVADTAFIKFDLDFDFSRAAEDVADGLTVVETNLTSTSPVLFTYRPPPTYFESTDVLSSLSIGGAMDGACCVRHGDDLDFVVQILNPEFVNARPHRVIIDEATGDFLYNDLEETTLTAEGTFEPLPPINPYPNVEPIPVPPTAHFFLFFGAIAAYRHGVKRCGTLLRHKTIRLAEPQSSRA